MPIPELRSVALDAVLDGPIELTIPADTRLVRLVRLVASGLASTAGFDVDELDDLRIAVDEAVAALLEAGDGSPLSLRFELGATDVVLTGETAAGDGGRVPQPDRLELSTQILAAVVDEHELDIGDDTVHVRICKRRGSR